MQSIEYRECDIPFLHFFHFSSDNDVEMTSLASIFKPRVVHSCQFEFKKRLELEKELIEIKKKNEILEKSNGAVIRENRQLKAIVQQLRQENANFQDTIFANLSVK